MMIDRIAEIKKRLDDNRRVFVNDLSREFGVSEVTIRKDLTLLEKQGIAEKFHGGAQLIKKPASQLPGTDFYNDRVLTSIAQLACGEIRDGDSIFLGSGRTCCILARMLGSFKNLTVITNNITALNDLLEKVERVYLIGGEVTSIDAETMFSSTQNPLSNIENISVKKAFTSVFGIDLKAGLTVNTLISTYIYKNILDISTSWYVMADHTKYDKVAIYPVAGVSDVSCFISDSFPPAYKSAFSENSVRFIERGGV
jgi:DeoR/GlpR family transcriptional regulator of sugar metabolism